MRKKREIIIHSFKKHSILCLGVMTLVYAMLMPDRGDWLNGMKLILTSPAYLVHDFVEVGGISAAFVNVGIHFLVAYYLMIRNEFSDLNGLQMAAIGIFIGHSFFGTNLLNILPIMIGVGLFAKRSGHTFKRYTTVSLFATSVAPLVSFVIFSYGVTFPRIIIGIFLGIVVGFFSAPLAEEFIKFHQGFTLYNFGFTTGMMAMIVGAIIEYFGMKRQLVSLISSHAHQYLLVYFLMISVGFLLISLTRFSNIKREYPRLLKAPGRVPTDYVAGYGLATTLFNMSTNTLMFLVIILISGHPLNGPLIGGLFTIMGFSAFGKNMKSSGIIGAGVLVAGLVSGTGLDNQKLLLAMLFSTGLSPIAGYYGIIVGLIAGFVHYNLVSVVFQLHLGLSLYNNGFSSGFVAAFLVPVVDTILNKKEEML